MPPEPQQQQQRPGGVTADHILQVLTARARNDKTIADLLESARWEATARLLDAVLASQQEESQAEARARNGVPVADIDDLAEQAEGLKDSVEEPS